ncbi:hypothetical protein [Nostoc sp. CMAA1605]|uniref:hypothetical protein n=1 Tax=Nostoc sp. CMAA1605 TaxID=2055159 RepID=UPI001F2A9B24|nr:hypothetical protein [Nostoc sp. CMAA1605]MCF4970433.1 hypothetical protein [Nostoc sp. CMAA1605]
MRINAIYLRIVINLSVFLALLSNNLIIHKVNAQNQPNKEHKLIDNEIYKYKYLQFQIKLRPNFLAQNTPLVPPKTISIPNNINIPTPSNPLPNSDNNLDETDKIQIENPDSADKKPSLGKTELEIFILNAITNSAIKYPWIIDPRDNFNDDSPNFNPLENSNYIDFKVKFSSEDSVFNQFTFANFPQRDQFYWVLPGNRVVVESKGWQSGVVYQGESTATTIREKIRLTQRLWGLQTVFALPESLQELTEEIGLNQFSVESIAAEVINPVGVPAAPIIINSGSDSNLAVTSLVPNISSFNSEKDPVILQTFPTSNLQPLLGQVSLTRGAEIPRATLADAGFIWGNPLTGQRTQFQPVITSTPGIKLGNREKFDNFDLYSILLNSSITNNQRNLYYLNSLYWIPLSERQSYQGVRETTENFNWYRFYFSYPHNRTLLEYDSLAAKATYTNIYTNPGLSLSLSFDGIKIDELQTANTTIGMLIGGIFKLVDFPKLTQGLQEAQERFSRQESFATFNSKATPEERKQINQRLNRTLFIANRNSGLEQVSGKLTFPSIITPNRSNILQLRTGNHRRAVQFLDSRRIWREGKTFISQAQVSNNRFGRLTSVNVPVPSPSNRSSSLQVSLTAPNGQQFLQSLSSSDMTSLPIDIRLFDIAFDNIALSQDGQLMTYLQSFTGYLDLPSIEVLLAGSTSHWNYSFNSGMWFNLDSNSAFNVPNNFGFLEPNIGIYTNGSLNYLHTHLEVDKDGNTQAITNHIPSLRFSWNSAANFQNPNYLNLSYFFNRQDRNISYSLTTGVILIDDKNSLTTSGIFQGQLAFNTGLELNTSLEIRDLFFYTLEGVQQINPKWSLGIYLQNFTSIEQGIRNRINDVSYGLIIKRHNSRNSTFWESRMGMSGDIFEANFSGGFSF